MPSGGTACSLTLAKSPRTPTRGKPCRVCHHGGWEASLKLIAWDFDGTLVDSRPLIEAGMAHALDALGQPRSVMEEWLKYVGLPVEAGIRNTFGPLGLDGDTVLKAYRSFGHAEHEHMMQPFEGIPELLAELKGRGQRMAVVTSKRRLPLLRQMAQWAGSPSSIPSSPPMRSPTASPTRNPWSCFRP